jgi:hypothetical protein
MPGDAALDVHLLGPVGVVHLAQRIAQHCQVLDGWGCVRRSSAACGAQRARSASSLRRTEYRLRGPSTATRRPTHRARARSVPEWRARQSRRRQPISRCSRAILSARRLAMGTRANHFMEPIRPSRLAGRRRFPPLRVPPPWRRAPPDPCGPLGSSSVIGDLNQHRLLGGDTRRRAVRRCQSDRGHEGVGEVACGVNAGHAGFAALVDLEGDAERRIDRGEAQ